MITPAIAIGDTLPDSEVQTPSTTAPISTVLGKGKSLLVGMPGAFTPTCTDEHLPGLIKNAPALAEQDIGKIVVVTANDNYVNTAWAKSVCSCMSLEEGEMPIEFVADPVGELLENLGMIAFLGKGLGVRSKRFALISENGVAAYVAVDSGSEGLHETSAETILAVAERLERQKRAAAAETAVAAELYKMSAAEALVYLRAQSERMIDEGVEPAVLEEAIEIVSGAASTAATSAPVGAEPPSAAAIGTTLAVLAAGAAAYYVYGAGGDLASLGVDVTSLSSGLSDAAGSVPAQ